MARARLSDLLERIPPAYPEAERAVLGAFMLEPPATFTRFANILRATDFLTDRHRRIFAAMGRVVEAGGAPEVPALVAELRRDEPDGVVDPEIVPLVAELAEVGTISTHLEHYVTLIVEMAAKRDVIRATTDLLHHAYDALTLPELAAKAAVLSEAVRDRMIAATPATRPERLGTILARVIAEMDSGPRPLIPTPLPGLNLLLGGGFTPGELCYGGGRPGLGKTALGLEFACHAATHGHPVLGISREMLVTALGRRLLAQTSGVTATALRRGILDPADRTAIVAALPKLHALPVWLSDRPITVAQIEALVRVAHAEHAIQFVIVDYLQLIQGPAAITEKRLAVEHISTTLKSLAMELGLVILCLSSLSRAMMTRSGDDKRPQLSDLRESGSLEHDADVVLLLHRPIADHPERVDLIVGKARDGATGTVPLVFDGATLRFGERSDREL